MMTRYFATCVIIQTLFYPKQYAQINLSLFTFSTQVEIKCLCNEKIRVEDTRVTSANSAFLIS